MNPYIGSSQPYLDGPVVSTLTLISKHEYHGDDGTSLCCKFQDSLGRTITLFTRKAAFFRMDVGTILETQFTVQSHHEFNGGCENIVKAFVFC